MMDLNSIESSNLKNTTRITFEGNSEGSFAWKGGLFYLDGELDGTELVSSLLRQWE